MDLAGIVVASLSALGTLVQAFYSAKSTNSEVSKKEIKKAEERASKPLKTGIKVVDIVIDDALLTTLSGELERHNSNLINAFRDDSISEGETSIKVEQASVQICKILSDIMRFNEGKLPTKRLEKLWASNRCKT